MDTVYHHVIMRVLHTANLPAAMFNKANWTTFTAQLLPHVLESSPRGRVLLQLGLKKSVQRLPDHRCAGGIEVDSEERRKIKCQIGRELNQERRLRLLRWRWHHSNPSAYILVYTSLVKLILSP